MIAIKIKEVDGFACLAITTMRDKRRCFFILIMTSCSLIFKDRLRNNDLKNKYIIEKYINLNLI